nr:uncharacterized protein LOC112279607 isoform X2 [Physcomitrium patens]|eukprot:XP_024369992.1 uncharacterized protein LOC112279607 isoform X2 [Physcomitrella patens]
MNLFLDCCATAAASLVDYPFIADNPRGKTCIKQDRSILMVSTKVMVVNFHVSFGPHHLRLESSFHQRRQYDRYRPISSLPSLQNGQTECGNHGKHFQSTHFGTLVLSNQNEHNRTEVLARNVTAISFLLSPASLSRI